MFFNEYLKKGFNVPQLLDELKKLLSDYEKLTGRFIFLYSVNSAKPDLDISLSQEDYYTIQDILGEVNKETIDFYLETPGGSGEAAEDIARYLRKKFKEVNFIIAGEAKSAGTILALSGDNIRMTETGSLGPIDAQVTIGRSVQSAYDYLQWMREIREKADTEKRINPVDAIILAQISPGEIKGVYNSIEFAKDLVKEWLELYKFKNWNTTESTHKTVTQERKKERAAQIADFLCNHGTWRSHGRSLKIDTLKEYLKIDQIEDNKEISNIIYRIKSIIRLLYTSSTIYKIYCRPDYCLNKTWMNHNQPLMFPTSTLQGVKNVVQHINLNIKCPRCNNDIKISGLVSNNETLLQQKILESEKKNLLLQEGYIVTCPNCKLQIDAGPTIKQIESNIKQTIKIFKKNECE